MINDSKILESIDEWAIIGITDPRGNITYANSKFCEVSGYSIEELIGQNHRILNSGYHSKEFFVDLWRTISTGKRWEGEIKNRAKDGSFYWVDTTIVPELDHAGRVRQYVSIRKDITVQKTSEIDLAAKTKLLKSIEEIQTLFIQNLESDVAFDQMLSCVLDISESEYGFIGEVLHSQEGKPYLKTHAITNIAWNKETKEFYEENAPKGLEFYNLKTLFGQVMETEKPVISNSPYTDPRRGGLPEGHPPLNHFLGIPIKIEDQLVGMMGVSNRPGGYDKSVIKLLSPYIQTCANLIVALRGEKQRQRALSDLGLKNQELEEVNKSLDSYVYRVSHDLKAPLNNIESMIKMIEMIQDIEKTSFFNEIMDNMKLSTSKLKKTVFDLLELSKVERQTKENAKWIFLEETIFDTLSVLKADISEVNALIDINLNVPRIYMDPIDLDSILTNFISNSIKYRKDTEQLRMSISVEAKGSDRYQIVFEDNGIGIDLEAYGHKMFKIFERLHNDENIEGTGIGLYMVKQIIKGYEGEITVESEVGKGVRLVITLPMEVENV